MLLPLAPIADVLKRIAYRAERGGAMPMDFTSARPDAVRAINQRWLLKLWTRHLGDARAPRWQSIKPDDLASLSDNLSLFDVTDDMPPRFLIRFVGNTVVRAYGSTNRRGRYLDEIVSPTDREQTIEPYTRAAVSGAPVYIVHDVTDRTGRLVHCERLMLPFARDGETIDRILVLFEFVCLDGEFDVDALMLVPGGMRELRLAATIEARAA